MLSQRSGGPTDNTNRNQSTRKEYVDLARKLKVPIRCVSSPSSSLGSISQSFEYSPRSTIFLPRCMHFTASRELAMHNNIYRAYLAADPPPGEVSQLPSRYPLFPLHTDYSYHLSHHPETPRVYPVNSLQHIQEWL